MVWLDPKDATPQAWSGKTTSDERSDPARRSEGSQSVSRTPENRPPSTPPSNPPTVDASIDDFEVIESRSTDGLVDVSKVSYRTNDERHAALLRTYSHALVGGQQSAFDDAVSAWKRLDDHHAVASVIDWEAHPQAWIATEYVDRRLYDRDTPLRTDEALWVITRAASALDHAHGYGILHGGLSPRTVVFTEVWEEDAWDYPKVTDWQLWWALYDHRHDMRGIAPGYAAPEQIQPERFGDVDASTDVYRLGVVAYEALTGRRPFEGGAKSAIRDTLRTEPTPVHQVNPTVPVELSAIVAKCLKKEKIERFETVQAVRRELAGVR